MSRIGKQPIKILDKIEIKKEGGFIIIKGPKGELRQSISSDINVEIVDNEINVSLSVAAEKFSGLHKKKALALWGTMRALIANIMKGVAEGFEKKLELHGVGHRATIEGKKLILSLGFSHPVTMEAPDGIDWRVEKNVIFINGIDKQLVGQIAAEIRAKKKPEPYKGKGIRYAGEVIRKKAGKKAAATAK